MESLSVTARGIPHSLRPFFQEYDLDDLDPERAAATIIERTLRYGNGSNCVGSLAATRRR
jgi:hypothetical protein